MLTKTLVILFFCNLIYIFCSVLLYNITPFNFYISTTILLTIGLLIYLVNNIVQLDYTILPAIALYLFCLLNIFVLQYYDEKLSIVNLLLGIFCFTKYYFSKKNFTIKI